MNRAQRRQLTKRKGAVFLELPLGSPFEPGEEFTIAGIRRDVDGKLVACEPGQETTFIAKPKAELGRERIIAK
jgi:hypothetical protein